MPKFTLSDDNAVGLLGTSARNLVFGDGDSTHGALTILDVADNTTRPPGAPEVQTMRVYDMELSASDKFETNPGFVLYLGGNASECIPWNASAAEVASAISSTYPEYGEDVVVTRSIPPDDEIWGLPSTPAPNGYTWTINYVGYDGDVPNPGADGGLYFNSSADGAACPPLTRWQRVDAQTLVNGTINPVSCEEEGCVDGVVLRGDFSDFSIPDDACTNVSVPWNAMVEEIGAAIEGCANGTRQVDVSRSVIDQYGTMEWEVTFTMNPRITPTGAGDITALSVAQNLTGLSEHASQPVVTETQQGSVGLSGTFALDYNDIGGSREVRFDEDADRMRRKLQEMSTISDVYVDLEEYPSSGSGGWGGTAVDDGTAGGYVWKVRFLTVPGTYNGETFPPGTGNVDAIVPSTSSLSGSSATVVTTTVTEGADEMGGGFALSFAGEVTETLMYTADETSVEAVLEDLSNVGDVSVSFDPYTPTRIADANVTVARDSSSAVISSSRDLRNFLSSGVVIRIGGDEASAAGTLMGTNGEGYLDYPGGVGHMYVLNMSLLVSQKRRYTDFTRVAVHMYHLHRTCSVP